MQKDSTFYLNAFKSYPIVKIHKRGGHTYIHIHTRHPPLKNYSSRRNKFRREQKRVEQGKQSIIGKAARQWTEIKEILAKHSDRNNKLGGGGENQD